MNNSIGPEGARHIAGVMTCNKRLKKINLWWNNIGNKGLEAICENLRKDYPRDFVLVIASPCPLLHSFHACEVTGHAPILSGILGGILGSILWGILRGERRSPERLFLDGGACFLMHPSALHNTSANFLRVLFYVQSCN